MKNLKYMSLLLALVSVMTVSFTSCGNDDEGTHAPIIKLEEANIEGDELCVEADIVAQGRTASILINVCDATGKNIKVAQPVTNSKYIGVLNVDGFHMHVDIAGKNVVVDDLLKLTVIDANGCSTTAQKAITEIKDENEGYDHD